MLMDIFSSLDDSNFNVFFTTFPVWSFSLFFVFFLGYSYWWIPSRWFAFLFIIFNYIFDQVCSSFGKNIMGFTLFVVSLFNLILVFNFLGLVPYVFSQTSHLVTTFTFAVPLWLSLILSSFFYRLTVFLASLLPAGAPAILNPFLVLVEMVSIGVRPITLSVRLATNIGAGHIVIGLLGTYLVSAYFLYFDWWVFIILLFIQVFYFFLNLVLV
uniref:ATP synthase subunit a n=1 Tax=Cephalothrix sp. SCS-2010 TaxID=743460 RepID=E7C1B0_9BILA|nr:ATP synthase F0 subunit 6 [Cephalothrix sp. SCS-2010]ADD62170.1 ATP synthase F0 subunit 6 [Cephalothrix sp. SCS-2010]